MIYISQDLAIQNSFNDIFNWLSKRLLIISGGNILIASLLAMGNIIVSPAILIAGLALSYEVKKALTKVQEYELEINTSIYKINSAQQLIQEQRQKIQEKRDEIKQKRQKISEATQQLNYINDEINKLEVRKQASQMTEGLANFTSFLLSIFPEYSRYKSIIPLVKTIVLKFLSSDKQSMLNNVIENLQEGDINLTIVGLDAVIEVNFDRNLLYSYPVDIAFNLDFLLSVSSKVINLIQLLENKTMLLFHTLEEFKISRK
ncbi:hypothetical protein [Anabaena sp. UHCC 0204]|uniref:coiled-coil domain-containing protein n=1 Tax=Anabaena sp. UHCC 0204 TaxID=2590009 RepID=UPI00144690EF|nr:hypothetical protein [Anabaena sp. UHCC 0204]MTJ10342.1 hypothetical protein [Anabaena sp. UHCC 0204]